MAQHDYVIDNQSAPLARADINAALQAIVTQNAGASAPTTTYADMFWYDTTNNQIKKRNEANSAWITLGTINESTGKFDPNASFVAVEQGGGSSMGTDKVYLGWNAIGMFLQVASTSLGRVITNVDATGASGTYTSTQMFAPGNAPLYGCRAWVNFNGQGTVAIRGSGNVSSITDLGTGLYTVNFTTPMIDTSYAFTGGYNKSDNGSGANADGNIAPFSFSTSSVNLVTLNGAAVPQDCIFVCVAIHR